MSKVYNKPYERVFTVCTDALDKLGLEIVYKSKKNGIIKAETGSSIFSWGEKVFIYLIEIEKDKTKVSVESKAKAQLIDWGKNDGNKYKILEMIEKLLK